MTNAISKSNSTAYRRPLPHTCNCQSKTLDTYSHNFKEPFAMAPLFYSMSLFLVLKYNKRHKNFQYGRSKEIYNKYTIAQ